VNVKELVGFNRNLRRDLYFINGAEALWYLKTQVKGPAKLQRQLPTLIMATMHRLSDSIQAQDSLEKMLVHEMAVLHRA